MTAPTTPATGLCPTCGGILPVGRDSCPGCALDADLAAAKARQDAGLKLLAGAKRSSWAPKKFRRPIGRTK